MLCTLTTTYPHIFDFFLYLTINWVENSFWFVISDKLVANIHAKKQKTIMATCEK